MRFFKLHFRLFKILFIPTVIIAVIYGVFLFKKRNEEDKSIGSFYLYHLENGKARKALLVWESRDCKLVSEYSNIVYYSLEPLNNNIYMDTLTLPLYEKVELVGIRCDSTVGVVKFPNKYFSTKTKETKINPRYLKACVNLKDLKSLKP